MHYEPIKSHPGPYTEEGRPLNEALRELDPFQCNRCGELMAPHRSDQFADEAWDWVLPDGSSELVHIAHLSEFEIAQIARNEPERAAELRPLGAA
jgi:hypothetical protein